MPFTVKIKCHGVMGYVESTNEKGVAVFLPKAGRSTVPNQVAYVRYPAAAYRSSREPAPRQSGAPRELRHIVLSREWLSIEPDMSQALELDKKKDGLGSPTPTSIDGKSLFWVPDLHELSGEHGDIKPVYFDDPAGADPRLIARVDLTQGKLGTAGVDPVQVNFDRRDAKNEPVRKPLARELELTLQVERYVTLRSKDLSGNPQNPLSMRFEATDDELEIVIGNESEADIYKTALPIQPIDTVRSPCMREFEVYYGMCAYTSEEALLPYLSSRPGSATCCSVAKFRPREITEPTPTRRTPRTGERPWTLLAYLAADNNLSTIADNDVDKLEIAHPHDVGIVVQVDRLGRPTERLVLEEDGFRSTLQDGNLNAGDPDILTNFLKDGQKIRPAKHTGAFLLSHGAGLLDFAFPDHKPAPKPSWLKYLFALLCRVLRSIGRRLLGKSPRLFFDLSPSAINPDQTSGDFLDNEELAAALKKALKPNTRFAIIGFDACVMALVELAYELRDCGMVLIASQDDVHLRGYPYDEILKKIGSQDPREVGKTIVTEFASATKTDKLATLSAVDLDKVEELVKALNALGELLRVCVEDKLPLLAAARNHARAFSNFHYIDLRRFMDGLVDQFGAESAIGERAKDVIKALDCAVICTSKDGCEEKNAYGLSVYLPNSEAVKEMYKKLDIACDASHWREFVFAYAEATRPPKEKR